MNWQPIDTAPKDGTMILLGWHNTEAWTRVDAAYASHGIWWGSSDGKGCYNATHWMPLPARPDAPAGEKGT